MRGIAYRRHQRQKKIARVRKYLDKWFPQGPSNKRVSQAATTPHPCSCYCCGNPRKHFDEVTIQEREFQAYCQCEE